MKKILRVMLLLATGVTNGEGDNMMIIAHRGASEKEPENTMRAFKKAVDLRADMIEFDVHACASGEIVVIHDETLERTTNGVGDVAKSTLAGLQFLHAGFENDERHEPIPTLEKVLKNLRRKIKINIELKGRHTGAPVARLLHHYIYHHKWRIDDIIVTSFMKKELKDLHAIMPVLKTGLIFDQNETIEYQDLPVQYIVIWHADLTPDIVKKAHEQNVKVLTYTINEEQDVVRAVQCDVDGIITDRPDLVRSFIKK